MNAIVEGADGANHSNDGEKGLRKARIAAMHIANLDSARGVQTLGTPEEETNSTKRTSYLPLLSPCPREETALSSMHDKQLKSSDEAPASPKASTSSVRWDEQEGDARRYSAKSRSPPISPTKKRSFEESPPVSPTNTSKKLPSQSGTGEAEQPNKRAKVPLVTLPNEIARTLLSALEHSAFDLDDSAGRQYRAMSVPRNMRSQVDANTRAALVPPRIGGSASVANTPLSSGERRESVRAQQLALLASQARLASSGATSIGTALRAEKAMKGAVWKAVEGVQAARQARNSIAVGLHSKQDEEKSVSPSLDSEGERSATSSAAASPSKAALGRDPTSAWSEMLASQDAACSFLDSAKEVAHSWANGFYAYEKEWVDGALSKEKKRLLQEKRASSETVFPASADSPTHVGPDTEEEVLPRRKSFSEPPTGPKDETVDDEEHNLHQGGKLNHVALAVPERRESVYIATSDSAPVTAAKRSLLAAQRRLSTVTALPGNRGKLVDVLSNFASLIDSRKEGCHSLEVLAQNARRLSSVPLPAVRRESRVSFSSPTKSSLSNLLHENNHYNDANSTASADSPRSVIV